MWPGLESSLIRLAYYLYLNSMLCWLCMVLGIFGGVGLAFLSEHLDDTLKRSEEIERVLGLPTLGLIPFSPNKAFPRADSLALIGDSQALLPSPDQRAA